MYLLTLITSGIFNKKMLMFSWFIKPFFSLATVSSDCPLRLNCLKWSIYYFNNNIWYKYTGITWHKDKYLMTDNKLRIPRKLKTETYKQLQIRSDMISICFCSSMFTNTTAWAKELGAIALPTFKKSWGGGNRFAPLFGIQFRKKYCFTLVWKHILSI